MPVDQPADIAGSGPAALLRQLLQSEKGGFRYAGGNGPALSGVHVHHLKYIIDKIYLKCNRKILSTVSYYRVMQT